MLYNKSERVKSSRITQREGLAMCLRTFQSVAVKLFGLKLSWQQLNCMLGLHNQYSKHNIHLYTPH